MAHDFLFVKEHRSSKVFGAGSTFHNERKCSFFFIEKAKSVKLLIVKFNMPDKR